MVTSIGRGDDQARSRWLVKSNDDIPAQLIVRRVVRSETSTVRSPGPQHHSLQNPQDAVDDDGWRHLVECCTGAQRANAARRRELRNRDGQGRRVADASYSAERGVIESRRTEPGTADCQSTQIDGAARERR